MSDEDLASQQQVEASNPMTSSQRLHVLSIDPYLRMLVAGNPAAPADLLEALARDQDEAVRQVVASNPKTSWAILERLAEEFPYEFLHNPVGPLHLLAHPEWMSTDSEFWSILLRIAPIPDLWWNWLRSRTELQTMPEWQLHVQSMGEAAHPYGDPQEEEYTLLTLVHLFQAALAQGIALPSVRFSHQAATSAEQLIREHLRLLGHDSDEYLKNVALQNELMPAETLRVLAQDEEVTVRQAVAGNEQTPVAVLQILAQDEEVDVRSTVACNKSLPVAALRALAQDQRAEVRKAVARNPRTSTETLQKLAQDENIWVQVSVAEHPQIPTNVLTAVLSTMAQNPEWRVRVEAAWNEHTPEEILQILAGDGVWFVRQAVASNGCAPAEALRLLARDHEADVRQRVAWNPQTPAEVLGTLARNPAWQVRAIVARHPRISEEILRILAVDEEEGVRQVVAHNTSAPVEVLQNLARDRAVKVRKAVVENPQAPEDILHILALDPDGEVRRQVRLLQRIVTEVGEPLQEKSWWGKLNQLLEDGHALDWTENALIARQLYSVANLGVSAELRRSILTALAIDWDFSMIRSAFDLEDSDGVMEFFGVIRESYEYVLAPFMSPVALKKLSLSPQWDVRYLVALHDRTPGEVRQRLSQDGNRYVRAMARARLAMLSESIPEE